MCVCVCVRSSLQPLLAALEARAAASLSSTSGRQVVARGRPVRGASLLQHAWARSDTPAATQERTPRRSTARMRSRRPGARGGGAHREVAVAVTLRAEEAAVGDRRHRAHHARAGGACERLSARSGVGCRGRGSHDQSHTTDRRWRDLRQASLAGGSVTMAAPSCRNAPAGRPPRSTELSCESAAAARRFSRPLSAYIAA